MNNAHAWCPALGLDMTKVSSRDLMKKNETPKLVKIEFYKVQEESTWTSTVK